MALTSTPRGSLAAAYGATGASWEAGAGRVYNHLADVVVSRSPVPVTGRVLLDVGAGTGAATRAIARAGGLPISIDNSIGMLTAGRMSPAPAVVADAVALPIRDRRTDGVIAAFSLNHVADPASALVEVRRVCRTGSPVVVAVYATDDDHPVKRLVEDALVDLGWKPEPWYVELRRDLMPLLATPAKAAAAAAAAALDADVQQLDVAFPWLDTGDLVAWRCGMAQHAPFVDRLDPAARDQLRRTVIDRLGPRPPVLVRSIIVIRAIA